MPVDRLARALELMAVEAVVHRVELPEDQVALVVDGRLVAVERAHGRAGDAPALAVVLAAVARAGEARRVGLHRAAEVHAGVRDRGELVVAVVADVDEPPREARGVVAACSRTSPRATGSGPGRPSGRASSGRCRSGISLTVLNDGASTAIVTGTAMIAPIRPPRPTVAAVSIFCRVIAACAEPGCAAAAAASPGVVPCS